MAIQTRKMTSQEFLAGPITNLPHELINGEEIMSPSPARIHQNTLGNLYIVVRGLAPNGEVIFAPMDVYLDEENVVQPDLLWIAEGSACHWVENKYLSGAPDL